MIYRAYRSVLAALLSAALWALCLVLLAAARAAPSHGAAPSDGAAYAPDPCWSGVWQTTRGFVWLAQVESRAAGEFGDRGILRDGAANGPTLRGAWAAWPGYAPPDDAGRFALTMTGEDCAAFTGTWGTGDDETGGGAWDGERVDVFTPWLGVLVTDPGVSYDGRARPPGDVIYLRGCPALGRNSPCSPLLRLARPAGSPPWASAGGALLCVDRATRAIGAVAEAYPDRPGASPELSLMTATLGSCDPSAGDPGAGGGSSLNISLHRGAARLTNGEAGRMISLDAQVGWATLDGPGAFVAAYDVATHTAEFAALGAPLALLPLGLPGMTLGPDQAVVMTGGGFGPVRDLPRAYLAMIRMKDEG